MMRRSSPPPPPGRGPAPGRWPTWAQRLGLRALPVNRGERLRVALGASLGVLLCGLVGRWLAPAGGLWLAGPLGATAVLLFAVPSSPFSQPWPVVGGNVLSAIVGILVAQQWGSTPGSAALAMAAALLLMLSLRCLHPPGGAMAVTVVIGGPALQALGLGWALTPVGSGSLLLVAAAALWHRLTRPEPVVAPVVHAGVHGTGDPAPQDRTGYTPADLDQALRGINQVIDIDRETLDSLLHQVEMLAWQRRAGAVRVADIMSRDLVTAEFATPLDEAWRQLHQHRIKALPVIDRARRVIGIVTLVDYLKHAQLDPRDHRTLGARVRTLLAATPGTHVSKPEVVGQIMVQPVQTVAQDMAVVELVPMLSDWGLHHLPVVDAEQRLTGIVTQSDLIAALYRVQRGN